MSVMSIRIDDRKRKLLKAVASLEGRSMSEVVAQLIDEYTERRANQLARDDASSELKALMRVSESAFSEWDNAEDAVYDNL